MKVRVGKALAGKLSWQREYMGDGAGTVFARALRKWRRLNEPGMSEFAESTYQGTVITVDVPDSWSAEKVRALLWWHLADVPDEPLARFVPPGVPGVDYVIEGTPDMIAEVPLGIDLNHPDHHSSNSARRSKKR